MVPSLLTRTSPSSTQGQVWPHACWALVCCGRDPAGQDEACHMPLGLAVLIPVLITSAKLSVSLSCAGILSMANAGPGVCKLLLASAAGVQEAQQGHADRALLAQELTAPSSSCAQSRPPGWMVRKRQRLQTMALQLLLTHIISGPASERPSVEAMAHATCWARAQASTWCSALSLRAWTLSRRSRATAARLARRARRSRSQTAASCRELLLGGLCPMHDEDEHV